MRLRRSNFDVIVVKDHLILVEGLHTFHLDSTLLNLEVCSFYIHLFESVNPIGVESENVMMVDWGQDVVKFIEENKM